MPRYSRLLLLAPVAVFFACAPAQGPRAARTPGSDAAAVRTYIGQANARFMDAFNRGDAAALAAMYTPDASVLAPNAPPVEGQANIEGLWTAARQQTGARTVALETTSVEVGGNQAVEVGNYTMTLQPQGGAEITDRGKYMVVWKRQPDGSWKLHRDMFNTSMPAQTPAASATAGRAAPGDTVSISIYHVKADKRAQVERFLHEVFWPMGRRLGETDPVVARTFGQTRILHPVGPNKDGTYTYAFLFDPWLTGGEYGIQTLLKKGFGEQEGVRIFKEQYLDALADRPYQFVQFRQSRD